MFYFLDTYWPDAFPVIPPNGIHRDFDRDHNYVRQRSSTLDAHIITFKIHQMARTKAKVAWR